MVLRAATPERGLPFLNVFTPKTTGRLRPVMVWLHGGGWTNYASTAPGLHGGELARRQDVVLVTVNHRLNAFGYLYLRGSDERFANSGNAGLLDLSMALRWVRDNDAAAFGGDPDNVTIFGQSGGAAKIAALLAMPAAKGLFHKAIVQSASGGLRLGGQEEALRQSADLAKALGLNSLDGSAAQAVPMETLIAGVRAVANPFRPVLDGRSFSADPYFPTAPTTAADIPLMIGCTNTETTWHLRLDPRNFALEEPDVIRRLKRFLGIDLAKVKEVIKAYRAGYPGSSPSDILVMVTSDYLFKRNTLQIAALQALSASAPVYAYVFVRETPIEGGRLRSPHSGEVPFIFGTTAVAAPNVGNAWVDVSRTPRGAQRDDACPRSCDRASGKYRN